MSEKRVVVTGLGALTPLGDDVNTSWENAKNGYSAAAPITYFDTTNFKTKFACQLQSFDPKGVLDRNEIKRGDLYTQYALYSSVEAMNDAQLDLETMNPFDIGVIWGSGQGGATTFEKEMIAYSENDRNPRFNPFFIPKFLINMASGLISMKFGLMGINYTPVSACASGNTALMDAYNYIKLGKAKVMLTGGSEAPINEASIGGFNALKALSTQNESPETASQPFDINRNGFVMGEGAVTLVLEDYDHAKARGAKIYAEVAGAAMTADAYHMTATHPEGKGAYESIRRALEEAKLNITEIDYINAHATSTPRGDVSEMNAIAQHVGSDKNDLHVSATKSMTGHLLGAAGAIEALFCIKSINDGVIPPTINTKNVDPEIPTNINIVCGEALEKPVNAALSNTFGFGGHNSTVVFKKI